MIRFLLLASLVAEVLDAHVSRMRPLLVLTSAIWDGVEEVVLSLLRDLDVRPFALTDDKVMVIRNDHFDLRAPVEATARAYREALAAS